MAQYDAVYRSEDGEKAFPLATGYISATAVFFEKEGVLAKIEARGCVAFWNDAGELLGELAVPAETEGRRVYEEVLCSVKAGKLLLRFPIVQWIDNYPNCDGEYDRWDSRTVGYHTLEFDPAGVE